MAGEARAVLHLELDTLRAQGQLDAFRRQTSNSTHGAANSMRLLDGTAQHLASTLGSLFAVTSVIRWGKECVNASMETENALRGLSSILDGQGRSFSGAQSFINAYISDGLVPLQNAVTAYKNLASRGYDDTQIQSVMNALKDSASYGRQASYTLGDAVTSATEGLKNENSILVDNAGVTKNVAKMWDDYAKSIGTTSNNLTQAQKIEAEVNGILEETRFQTGDAAKVAETFSGQLAKLSASMTTLRTAVGDIIKGVIAPLVGWLNQAVKAAADFAEKIRDMLGFSVDVGSIGSFSNGIADASANADMLTDSLINAQEAAEQLGAASFDDFNIIGIPETNSGADSSGDDSGLSVLQTAAQVKDVTEQVDGLLAKLKNSPAVMAFWENFRKQMDRVDFSGIQENFERIMTAFRPIAQSGLEGSKEIFTSFSGFAGTALGGISGITEKQIGIAAGGVASFLEKQNGTISDWVRKTSKTISDGFENLNISADGIFDILFTELDNAKPALEQGISDLLTGLSGLGMSIGTITADMFKIATGKTAEFVQSHSEEIGKFIGNAMQLFSDVQSFIGGVFGDVSEMLDDFWQGSGKVLWENITDAVGDIGEWFLHIWNDILLPVFGSVKDEMSRLWSSSLKPMWNNVLELFGSIGNTLSLLWSNVMKPVLGWIEEKIFPVVRNVAQTVISILSTVFEVVTDIMSGIIQMFSGVLDFVTGVFTRNFDTALGGIRNILVGFGNGVIAIVAGVVNLIIDGVNAAISLLWGGIGSAINTILAGAGDVLSFVLGKEISWGLPAEPPMIPKVDIPLQFAKGAIVHQPTLAMVGDNPNAYSDPEVISPLSKLKGMIADTGGGNAVIEAKLSRIIRLLEDMTAAIGEIDTTVVLDGRTIYNASKRHERRTFKMKGENPC